MTQPAQAANRPTFTTAALDDGIVRGDDIIRSLTLRRPNAGELRGLALQDVMRADVGAMITLIPRISDPTLMTAEVEAMSASDFAEVAGAVAGFFFSAAQMAMVQQMSGAEA